MKQNREFRSFTVQGVQAGLCMIAAVCLLAGGKPALAETVYTVQAASLGQPESARSMAGALRSKGFDAFACRLRDNRDRDWYVVLVGLFASRRDADQEIARYRGKTGADAFVKTYDRGLLAERLIDGRPGEKKPVPAVASMPAGRLGKKQPAGIKIEFDVPDDRKTAPAESQRNPVKPVVSQVVTPQKKEAPEKQTAAKERPAEEDAAGLLAGFDDEATTTAAAPESSSANTGGNLLAGFDDEASTEVARESSPASSGGDLMAGFEDDGGAPPPPGEKESAAAPSETESQTEPSNGSVDGFARLGATWNFAHKAPAEGETDWRGLSRLRPELQVEINQRMSDTWRLKAAGRGTHDFIYEINGKEEYTLDVLENYETEFEIGEAYIMGSLTRNLDIRFGRQIVVWGKSDTIRVTDIINPEDSREPALTDIDDLRLPLVMTRLDYYIGEWNLTGIAIHEIRFDKNPEYGNDFYPSPVPLPPEEIPDHGGENTEFACSASAVFSGWDVAFYGAYLYDDMFYLESVSEEPGPSSDSRFGLHLDHARIKMLGAAFNLATGNWLLKTESAYLDGIQFFNPAKYDGAQFEKSSGDAYSRVDMLGGFEYMGLTDMTISLDAVFRYINNYDQIPEESPNRPDKSVRQWVARVSRNFLHETLMLEILVSGFGWRGEDGAFQRFIAEYDFTDSLMLRAGALLYQSGDALGFQTIGDCDRAFAELKYSF